MNLKSCYKIFFIIFLNMSAIQVHKQPTINRVVILEVPRKVLIERLQKRLFNWLGAYKPDIVFTLESMPHITLIEIHDLPANLENRIKLALKEAQEEFIRAGSYGIANISITEGIELLGQKANRDLFLAVHIDESLPSYQKIQQLRNIILKKLNKHGISKQFYEREYPWTPHITLGKADQPIPRKFRALRELLKVDGIPFRADAFALLGKGHRHTGYILEEDYPLYPTSLSPSKPVITKPQAAPTLKPALQQIEKKC